MSSDKCPHCEYYMWEGKEFYECGLQQENAELKAENERLKNEFRIESLTDKTTGETIYRSNLVNKYRIILQDIMVIAEETVEKYYPDYYDEGFEEDIVTEFAQQILQKISEVE